MNSYLGQTPVFGDFPFQILSGDGTSFYELNFKTNGTNGLLVFLNGAVQRPGIDFTCDGNALTFSANVSVGVQIFVYGMGLPKSSLAPSAGSVGVAELSADVRAFNGDAQDWTNLLKILTPKGLNDSLKGSNQLLAANGYQKLPGGLIIQWGSVTVNVNVANEYVGQALTWPVTFPNAVLSVGLGPNEGIISVGFINYEIVARTVNGASVRVACAGAVGNRTYTYIAIGH